jgi:hypothetical protein
MTAKLPSLAVRNAIAFVDVVGDFPRNIQVSTRLRAREHGIEFNHDYDLTAGARVRFYNVTDAGRAVADKGTLAHCLRFAKELGFEIDMGRRGRPKPGYIPLKNAETGAEAFVSSGRRVYMRGQGIGYEIAFEAKAGK